MESNQNDNIAVRDFDMVNIDEMDNFEEEIDEIDNMIFENQLMENALIVGKTIVT